MLMEMGVKRFLAFVLMIVAIGASARADDYETRRAELIKGLPSEVVAVIDRLVMCNHWSDESPYDAERARMIEAAVTQLRCDTVDADASALQRQYGPNSASARALEQARDWFP